MWITSNPEMIDPVFPISGNRELTVHANTDRDPRMVELPEVILVGSADPSAR